MDDFTQNESDDEFPDLPPNIMLDMGLEDDSKENETRHTTSTDELGDELHPPIVLTKDEKDDTSSSSESSNDESILDIYRSNEKRGIKQFSRLAADNEVRHK